MADTFANTSSESWDVYRKLVVETLKKLDERADAARSSIEALQNKNTDKDFAQVEKHLDDLEKTIESMKSTINTLSTEVSNGNVRRNIFMVIAGGVWGVIILFISSWLNIIIPPGSMPHH